MEAELIKFMEHLNSRHRLVKFTATYNIKTRLVMFLDMDVWIDDAGSIQTNLLKKDTAICQYLMPSSCHPSHQKTSHIHLLTDSVGYAVREIDSKNL